MRYKFHKAIKQSINHLALHHTTSHHITLYYTFKNLQTIIFHLQTLGYLTIYLILPAAIARLKDPRI